MSQQLSMRQVLICGALVVTLAMGVRHGFGLWLNPITEARGWTRESFSFAMALQNLSWGLSGIFMGMLADRFGAFRVIVGCALLYALGLYGMATAESTAAFAMMAGILIGVAQAGTTYAVIYGVIGRNVPAEKRSWAMGVAAAAGSFGQFLMLPLEQRLIEFFGWQQALMILAGTMLLAMPVALGLRERQFQGVAPVHRDQSAMQAIREALGQKSFVLLLTGYFVCGFQVVFIGVHMPSYVRDLGMSPSVATWSLALIGLFNVFGSYLSGSLGQRLPRTLILASIYGLRSLVIVIFLLVPPSPLSVYIFSATMGFLWLSTVPPTNAVVANIFGVTHLSMLSGVVFFSHQIGSFLGVWLGGYLYDRTGSYDIVWYISIGLGVLAALVNLPIRETPLRPQPLPAAA